VCVCVCMCVCAISRCTFLYLQYIYLYHTCCAKIRVWSCLVTGNFGLFTEIAVCKFLRGWRAYSPKPFLILSIVCVYTFFCSFLYGVLCPRVLLGIMRHRNVHYYYYYYCPCDCPAQQLGQQWRSTLVAAQCRVDTALTNILLFWRRSTASLVLRVGACLEPSLFFPFPLVPVPNRPPRLPGR